MGFNAAFTLFFISSLHLLAASLAQGNIGCLFSETLCAPRESCFDDYAFGRCLTDFGNVHKEDMHRYKLGSQELHLLEQEMQRLFLLGYRWSHTYTQCVLQALLVAIRSRSEFDLSSCNADLDQDLEGALKAIEGEEMEHIDPRNLAIVRFTPSVVNPHSDYADELYYPPIELMPPIKGKGIPHDNQADQERVTGDEQKEKVAAAETEEEIVPVKVAPPNTGSVKNSGGSGVIPPFISPNDINAPVMAQMMDEFNYPRPSQIEENFSDGDQYHLIEPEIVEEEMPEDQPNYDRYTHNWDTSGYPGMMVGHSRPSFYKRGYVVQPFDDLSGYQMDDPSARSMPETHGTVTEFVRDSLKNVGLREFARKLANIRQFDTSSPKARHFDKMREAVFFPEGKERIFPPRDQRVRDPARDKFYEGVLRLKSSDPNAYYYRNKEVYVQPKMDLGKIQPDFTYNDYMTKQQPDKFWLKEEKGIPVLEAPDENDSDSDSIHPQYEVPSLIDKSPKIAAENYENHQSQDRSFKLYNTNGDIHDSTMFNEVLNDDYPNNEMKNNYLGRNGEKEANSPSRFTESQMTLESEPEKEVYPHHDFNQAYPSYQKVSPNQYKSTSFGAPIHSGYYDQFYSSYYPDYSEYPVEYYDYGSEPHWNLQRNERLDVKKPGPFFNSKNDFSFNYVDDQGRGPKYQNALNSGLRDGNGVLFDRLRQDYDAANHHKMGEGHQQHPMPDLLLTDERMVETLSGKSRGHPSRMGDPKVAYQVAPAAEKSHNAKNSQQDTYVYITTGGSFPTDKEARELVNLILGLVNVKMDSVENIRVKENQVRFEVPPNDIGLTAAGLAERTEELRDKVKSKTGMEIIQAGVGTKEVMRAVVYKSGLSHLVMVGAIVCGSCAAIIVGAATLYLLRKHAYSKAKLQGLTSQDSEAEKDYQDLCRARMSGKDSKEKEVTSGQPHPLGGAAPGRGPGQRISSLSKDSDNGANSPSSRSSTSSWSEEPVVSNMDISTGHMVLSYMEDHLKNKDRLEKEWTSLCSYEAEPCASFIAQKPENVQKNRYKECVPYDHNRVILNEHTNVSGSNYINASSITDHDPRNPAYIATQGPLAATSADFWQLIWEQGSVVIVMLTRLSENGIALSHRYWPEEGSELYHIYEVHLVSEHTWCDDYLVRSFYLKNLKTGETRTVTQFHFLSWPEAGIPTSTKAMLEFRRKVNKSYRGRSCPIIVHCSDGVGRTGTYCLIDMVLNRMAKGAKEIDIAATLEHIRDQRPNMVKTKIQFEFVLMAVAEEVHAILKALPQ